MKQQQQLYTLHLDVGQWLRSCSQSSFKCLQVFSSTRDICRNESAATGAALPTYVGENYIHFQLSASTVYPFVHDVTSLVFSSSFWSENARTLEKESNADFHEDEARDRMSDKATFDNINNLCNNNVWEINNTVNSLNNNNTNSNILKLWL